MDIEKIMKNNYPTVVCLKCGKKAAAEQGTKSAAVCSNVATIYKVDCPVCGAKDVEGTQPRDFGYPEFKTK